MLANYRRLAIFCTVFCIEYAEGFLTCSSAFNGPASARTVSTRSRNNIVISKRRMPEMRFAPSVGTTIVGPPHKAPNAPKRAPLYLDDDGIWLPEDDFAFSSQVVRIPAFLSKSEIEEIHRVAQAVKKSVGSFVRKLPVDLEHSNSVRQPPWVTTYLQSLGYNQRLMPELLRKIENKVVEVDSKTWNILPDRKHFNVRVHEYHEVSPGGSLPAIRHRDYGSLITIDFMLSDTKDFKGGRFQTLEPDGSLKQHTFEQGDMILFLSHKYHSVTPVTEGRRNVMVMEFWQGNERRCGYRCVQHHGVCRSCDLRFPNGITAPSDL